MSPKSPNPATCAAPKAPIELNPVTGAPAATSWFDELVKSTQTALPEPVPLGPTAIEGWLEPAEPGMVRTSPNVMPPSALRATTMFNPEPNRVKYRFPYLSQAVCTSPILDGSALRLLILQVR